MRSIAQVYINQGIQLGRDLLRQLAREPGMQLSIEQIMQLDREVERELFMQLSIEQIIRLGKPGMPQDVLTKHREIVKKKLLELHLDLDIVQKATDLPKNEREEILQENK